MTKKKANPVIIDIINLEGKVKVIYSSGAERYYPLDKLPKTVRGMLEANTEPPKEEVIKVEEEKKSPQPEAPKVKENTQLVARKEVNKKPTSETVKAIAKVIATCMVALAMVFIEIGKDIYPVLVNIAVACISWAWGFTTDTFIPWLSETAKPAIIRWFKEARVILAIVRFMLTVTLY